MAQPLVRHFPVIDAAYWLTSTWRSCVYLFTAAYGVSYGPIAWVLMSEVFPLSVRSKGMSMSTASNWLNNCQWVVLWSLVVATYAIYSFRSPHWACDAGYG